MADEKVVYSFEGDVSSLASAVSRAIGLLGQYETALTKQANKKRLFKGSQESLAELQASVQKASRALERLKTLSGEAGKVNLKDNPELGEHLESVLNSLIKALAAVKASTGLTDEEMKKMAATLNYAARNTSAASTQARQLAAANAQVKQQAQQAGTQVQNTATKTKQAATSTKSASSAANSASSAFSKISNSTNKVSNGFKNLSLSGARLPRLFSHINSNAYSLNSTLKQLDSSTLRLKTLFAGIIGLSLADMLKNAVKESISFIENQNLFQVAMGESLDKANEFVNTMTELYGMDPSALMRYVGFFNQLSDAIGVPAESARIMSLGLTKMGVDLSSLFNMPIETVMEDLGSGMQGMTRAVRKYGMDLRTTTLQQTALAYGLTGSVETMSEANRQALRYITIVHQASNAAGDFAKTIESPANQLRVFTEQIKQLGRAIGNFLIGPLAAVLPYINAVVMALRKVLTFFSTILGFEPMNFGGATDTAEELGESVGGIGDTAEDTSKKLKQLQAPFDELNILQKESATSGAGGGAGSELLDPRLKTALSELQLEFENIEMKANRARDAIIAFFGFKVDDENNIFGWDPNAFERNLIDRFPEWTKTIQSTFDNWSSIINGFKKVFSSIKKVISDIKERFLNFFGIFVNDDTMSSFIEGLPDKLDSLAQWIDRNSDKIVAFGEVILGLVIAFKGLEIISGILTLFAPLAGLLSTIPGPTWLVVGAVAALVIGLKELYDYGGKFREAVDTIWSTLSQDIAGSMAAIWDSLKSSVEEYGPGLLDSVDTLLGGITGTIGSVAGSIIGIITNIFSSTNDAWESDGKTTWDAILQAIQSVLDIVNKLWYEVVNPVITWISEKVASLWNDNLSGIFDTVLGVLQQVLDLVNNLLNLGFKPLTDYLDGDFSDTTSNVFSQFDADATATFDSASDSVNELLGVLESLLAFLNDAFVGDSEKAATDFEDIFLHVGNFIIGCFEGAFNFVITIVNVAIGSIYDAIVYLLGIIADFVNEVGFMFGMDSELFSVPTDEDPWLIPTITFDRISRDTVDTGPGANGNNSNGGPIYDPSGGVGALPGSAGWNPNFATGGVVTGPTLALIGEAGRDEVVMPLDDSPQMKKFIEDIVDAIDKNSSTPEVKVIIGDQEWDTFTYKSAERGKKLVGARPVKVGGYA